MTTQRANPGGILAPDEIIGRDDLVRTLWETLKTLSVYITAERRMGKSSVVRDNMCRVAPRGQVVVYLDTSKAGTPPEFVEAIASAALLHEDDRGRVKITLAKFQALIPGLKLQVGSPVRVPKNMGTMWKELLSALLEDLGKSTTKSVLVLDEFPLMLEMISRNEATISGKFAVMEVLNVLRAARQEHNVRMIYTGSLGLHHVLNLVCGEDYQNDPTNDMHRVELEPLSKEYAVELSLRLIVGEKLDCDDIEAISIHIANVTDGMPFYIHLLVAGLRDKAQFVTIEAVDTYLAERLRDLADPWSLRYFDGRIDTHYSEAHRPVARAMLDQLAARQPMKLQELRDGIAPQVAARDYETVRTVLQLLGMDHYIHPTDAGFKFKSQFIRRVWQVRRGIGP